MKILNGHSVKYFLFILIIGAMTTPLIHSTTGGTKGPELQGAVNKREYIPFSWQNWFNHTYQKNTTAYLNENFGFRNYFVRFHNQRMFGMYNFAKANGVVIGKDNYLFELDYIKAHYGLDFIGFDQIVEKSTKLKFVQDKLKSEGKELIIVIAPGKGSFFSEFIPEKYNQKKIITQNYKEYIKSFNEIGITYVDFKSWFKSLKGASKYPLYPKCGIHWSEYGEYLVADSLLKHIETITGRTLPKLILDSIVVREENSRADYDIGEGMNLLWTLPTFSMAYPYYHYKIDASIRSTKILTVADSYYWGMFDKGMSRDCFNGGQFWFYNQQIFPESFSADLLVKDIHFKEEINKNDVILLISTDATLDDFGFGFIEQLYLSYREE